MLEQCRIIKKENIMKENHNCLYASIGKRSVSLILVLAMIVLFVPFNPITASSASFGNHGDLYYRDDGDSLTITAYIGQSTSVVIPAMIDGKPVTAVGDRKVTSTPQPNVKMYTGTSPFQNNTNIVSITLPDTVTSIGAYTFNGCSNLSSITLPNSLVSIGDSAFQECTSLESLTIPNNVTSIGERAFIGCIGLENLTLSNKLLTTGDHAFYFCSSLRSVTVPGSLSNIGVQMFGNCTSLSTAVIENGVTSIGLSMFFGCSSLQSMRIPSSVTFIDNYAFYGSSNLYDIYLDSITPPNVGTQSFGEVKPGARAIIPSGATAYGLAGSNWNGLIVYDLAQPTTYTVQTSVNNATLGSASANTQNAAQGTEVSLYAIPNSGCSFVRWEVISGNATITNPTSSAASFIMPANNMLVRAVFEAITAHVPVTSIIEVPTASIVGKPLTLTGTVIPYDSTNNMITWSVMSAGTTGATVSGNTLYTTSSGIAIVRATINNGSAIGINYTQDFALTVSEPLFSDPFTMDEDNYRFYNTFSSFGYPYHMDSSRNYISDYSIPLERFLEIYDPTYAQYYYRIFSPWGGNCYGFAASSYALEDYRLSHSDYQSGIFYTYSFNTPGSPNNPVTKLIELYQISQCLDAPSLEEYLNTDNLNALVSAVNNEDGLIVTLEGLAGGHAVIAYGIEYLGGSRYSLKIYDSNQPENKNLRIEVDTSKYGSSGWAFNSTDTQSYNSRLHSNISFIHGETIYNAIEIARNKKSTGLSGMQINVPVNTEITDTKGISVEDIDRAYRFMPVGILPLNPDGSDPTPLRTTELWVVPSDDYTVVVAGTESTSISVLDERTVFTINLLPEDNNMIVELGAAVEIEGAVHGNIIEYLVDGTELMIPVIASSTITIEPGGNMEIAEFNDVKKGDWFDNAVTSVASVGIVEGVDSRSFDPQGTLTVAQFITMLMRTQYGHLSGGRMWHSSYIDQAVDDGILLVSDNLEPGAKINRAQAALIITRFVERYNPRWARYRIANAPVDMAEVPNEYRTAVNKAYTWSIINGDNNNQFNPNNTLTRAEAAQILYNYYSIVD